MLYIIVSLALFFFTVFYGTRLFKLYIKKPKDLRGSIVLVTGAGGALGKNLVEEFLNQGCIVVGCDVHEDLLAQLRKEMNRFGGISLPPRSEYYYSFDATTFTHSLLSLSLIQRNR
jgi:hypothetical protein